MSMTTTNYLGRCFCGYALRADETQVAGAPEAERYNDMQAIGTPYRLGSQVYVRCENRHKPFKLFRIEGEYSEAFQCDARCENAKGHECKCSCGGMNHGKAYDVLPSEVHNIGATLAAQAVEPVAPVKPVAEPESRPYQRPTKVHLGVEGEEVEFDGKVIFIKHLASSTLYKLVAYTDEGEAKLTWFAPDWINFELEKGQEGRFQAQIKRHEESDEYGPDTVVTHLQEVE